MKTSPNPYTAISVAEKSNKLNNSNWEIQHQCPQCGAPVVLEETDRLFMCPFCRVKLYLSAPDFLRYCFVPAQSLPADDLFYTPYWRFKGMAFNPEAFQIRETFIDATASASSNAYLPATLGLRPQAVRLRFVSPDIAGNFLKHDIPIQETFGFSRPYRRTFIGETISLVYNPVIIRNRAVLDAFTEKPFAHLSVDELNTFMHKTEKAAWQVRFIATLCPDCGWNLEGERDSCALFCRNCNTAWQASGRGFEKLDFASVGEDADNIFYLPFWKIKALVKGLELKTYADLVKLANLPKAIKDEWYDSDVYFWAPAFKVRPELFLRVSRSVTISEYQGELEENLPKGFLHPVTLPVSEAAESLKLVIADTAINKKKIFPLMESVSVDVEKHLLVYLPFALKLDELYNPRLHLTINKNSLKFGRNL